MIKIKRNEQKKKRKDKILKWYYMICDRYNIRQI